MKKLIIILLTIHLSFFTLHSFSQTWTWYEDQLSYARWGLTATTLDDTIFYSGGKNTSATFTNIWDIYDIGADEWDTVELSSEPRWNAVMISANGKVFCAGGSNYGGLDNFTDVDIYDKETGEWTIDHLSLGRTFYYGSSITFGNEVWFAGGHRHTSTGPMEYTNLIDIYNTETNTWTTDSLSVPRCFMGGVVAGGKVFFAGGATGEQTVTNVIDIYDINTGDWSIEYLSEPRALVAAVAYGNKVYFAGGAKPDEVTSTIIDIYNFEDGMWEDIMNLQNSRIVTALKVKNSLLFTGIWDFVNLEGPLYFGPLNGVVEIYYPETDQWDYTVPNLNPPRMLYAFTSYGNKAYYGGGAAAGYIPVSTVSILVDESNCLPEGITFTTQEQIDSFQTNYQGCTEIEGDVTINGEDITSLIGLNVITAIEGKLEIVYNDLLNSLSGLDNLFSVGAGISIEGNSGLTSLASLGNLYSVSGTWGFGIHDNDALTSLIGLDNLTSIQGVLAIRDNDILTTLTGLNNLTTIEGYLAIGGQFGGSYFGNPSLVSLSALENLTSVSSIYIYGNDVLFNLTGLNNIDTLHSLTIGGNDALSSLIGLDNLASIGGYFSIENNNSLQNLSGLSNLTSIGVQLNIYGNESLSECDAQSICDFISSPNGPIYIEDNAPGCNSIEEVEEACWNDIDEISINDQITISHNPNSGIVNIRIVTNDLGIVNCELFNLSGVKIKTIINEEKTPGIHEMAVDLSNLPPGVHICVLKTNNGIVTKKIVKL